MKRAAHFLSLMLLAAMLAVSCRTHPELKEAERLLEEQPDSALTLLEGVPRESLRTEREQARYDYLSATAFYNTYFFLDDPHALALSRAYHFKEVQRMRLSNLALLVSAILATLVLYFWARKSQTEKLLLQEKEENDRLLSAAEELQQRMVALEGRKDGRGAGDSLATLDRLCEQYYVYEGTDNLQPRILKEVRSIVEGLRSDPKTQRTLEQALDQRADGVMKRLRAAFPKWKEEDFLLYLFTASGFSSTTISTLLEKDKAYVYNRLYRLKERIKAADAPDTALFLSLLEK